MVLEIVFAVFLLGLFMIACAAVWWLLGDE